MSADYVDISVPLQDGMAIWPDSPGVAIKRHLSLDAGDPANASWLGCDVHCGTHVDAPEHAISGGGQVLGLDLDALIGPAYVVALDERVITADVLDAAEIPSCPRLLVRSSNSGGWDGRPFDPEFAALEESAAAWVAEREIRLIGVDYLSVQRFTASSQTHVTLLAAGVVILEGLELATVASGWYELICLPLALADAEGAPARAVLRSLPEGVRPT